MKNKQVQNLILDNANSLLESALILQNNNKNYHSAHFAIYCIEECAKCLMISPALKQFNEDKHYTNHYKKEESLRHIFAILGRLTVCYHLEYMSKSNIGDEEWRQTRTFNISNRPSFFAFLYSFSRWSQ